MTKQEQQAEQLKEGERLLAAAKARQGEPIDHLHKKDLDRLARWLERNAGALLAAARERDALRDGACLSRIAQLVLERDTLAEALKDMRSAAASGNAWKAKAESLAAEVERLRAAAECWCDCGQQVDPPVSVKICADCA